MPKVCDLEKHITDVHWFPSHSKRLASSTTDVFVASCVDGSFLLVSNSGRIDKVVKDAHDGAIVTVRWDYEGNSIATGGEDGNLKIWSRAGQLRSTLASTSQCIYSIAWGPSSEQVLYSSGKDLIIKPINPSNKHIQWKAHDGCVLKVDWNPLTKLIVSAGEDGRYKVWDSYGRLLFSSGQLEYSITSVSWSPSGEIFAVGSFNMLKVCDKTGWTYSRCSTNTGSILNISWTSDGTQLAAAGGNGVVSFGQLVERSLEWKNLIVSLTTNGKIRIQDILNDTMEEFDFRDKVVNWSIGFGHMVVATSTQCWIYDVQNWNTPHVFDVKDTINLFLLCKKNFLVMDNFNGIQIYSYEGRLLCNPKFAGLRTEFLNYQSVSVSNDVIAVIDKGEGKSQAIRFLDANSGKQLGDPLTHTMEVIELELSHFGSYADRKCAFIDRNGDLYITSVTKRECFKLATMVESIKWNDQTDMLSAISDGKFVVWYYPSIVLIDRDLLPLIKVVKTDGDFGKKSHIMDFFGSRCNIRKWDGSIATVNSSPYPILLYELVEKKAWESAIRLCRYVKDKSIWACLVAMSIKEKEISTAEVALAAIEEVDKLQYMIHIKNIPSVEGRNAALSLYMRCPDEAESILLQAGLYYRAIKMHIKLYNWKRALDLATRYKTHVDTVLAYRRQYLEQFKREETNAAFLQYASVVVDWTTIQEKTKQEKLKEKQR